MTCIILRQKRLSPYAASEALSVVFNRLGSEPRVLHNIANHPFHTNCNRHDFGHALYIVLAWHNARSHAPPYLVLGRLDRTNEGGHRISGGVVDVLRLASGSLCWSGHELQLMWSGESIVDPRFC